MLKMVVANLLRILCGPPLKAFLYKELPEIVEKNIVSNYSTKKCWLWRTQQNLPRVM